MPRDQETATAESLASVLAEIDAGGLEATEAERAFIAGAEHAVRAVAE